MGIAPPHFPHGETEPAQEHGTQVNRRFFSGSRNSLPLLPQSCYLGEPVLTRGAQLCLNLGRASSLRTLAKQYNLPTLSGNRCLELMGSYLCNDLGII